MQPRTQQRWAKHYGARLGWSSVRAVASRTARRRHTLLHTAWTTSALRDSCAVPGEHRWIAKQSHGSGVTVPLHPGTGTCVPRFLAVMMPFCGSRHGESARDFLSPNCVNLFPGATAQPGTRAMPSRCWPRGGCQSKCATPSTGRRRFSSRAAAAMAMQRRDGRCARLGQILTRWTPDVGTDAKQKQLRSQYSTGLNIMDDFQFSLIPF